jgi:hypothetical protein
MVFAFESSTTIHTQNLYVHLLAKKMGFFKTKFFVEEKKMSNKT